MISQLFHFSPLFMFLLCFLKLNAIDISKAYREETQRQLSKSPISDLALCIFMIDKMNISNSKSKPKEALGEYLGRGFDSLIGETKLSVFGEAYHNCNTSADFKYFVPDFYRAEKLYTGNVEKSSSLFSSTNDYQKSSNSNGGLSGKGSNSGKSISGSFSSTNSEAKSNIEKSNSSMFVLKSSMVLYHLLGSPAASFNRAFQGRIEAIINATRLRFPHTARYLIEEVYRDYGTDVVMSANLGVQIERRIYVSNSYVKSSSEKRTSFQIGLQAASTQSNQTTSVKASMSKSDYQKALSEVNSVEKTDKISVWGGPDFDAMNSDSMENLMKLDNVAALSCETEPLYRMIHGGALSALNATTDEITDLRMKFQQVYEELFERNTYRGCTNPEFYNFDFQANIDDNSCTAARCGLSNIDFNCSLERTVCSPNQQKYKDLLVQLRSNCFKAEQVVNEEWEYMTSDETEQKFETKKLYYSYEKTKKKIYDLMQCKTERSVDGPPTSAFFANADSSELQACIKRGEIVETKNNSYLLKKCDNNIPEEWKKNPIWGGFYQTCTPSEKTAKFEKELNELKKGRVPPCNIFETKNIVTNDFTCPTNTVPELVTTYIHVPSDFFTVYKEFLCDYENGGGCQVFTFEITLKDAVNISTYWCNYKNDSASTGIFFGGMFSRKHINTYLGAEGCAEGMRDVRIFNDVIFCVTTKAPYSVPLQKIPELRYLYSSQSNRAFCPQTTSKHLVTVINGKPIYACIFKKLGYNNAPIPSPIGLPFHYYTDILERKAASTLVYYNDPNRTHHEIILLEGVHYELTLTIKDKIKQMTSQLLKTTTTPETLNDMKDLWFNPNYIIMFIIIIVFAVIIVSVIWVYSKKR